MLACGGDCNDAPRVLVCHEARDEGVHTRLLVCYLANETGNRNDAPRVSVCHKEARDKRNLRVF